MLLADWTRKHLSLNHRFLFVAIVCGMVCGVAAVAFHLSIEGVFHALWTLASGLPPVAFTAMMIAAPTFAGLLVGLVTTFWVPEAVGSGIPQTKEAYHNRGGRTRTHIGLWRFFLGTVFIGLGNSLGREGPTVHISSAIASRLGRWGFRDPERQRAMIPIGMAAGVGAAFNAPLSAITFVFEELLDHFNAKALGAIVIAVVVASAISRTILGDAPILSQQLDLSYKTSGWMLVAIPLGVVAGLLGHLFVSVILKLRKRLKGTPRKLRWMLPGIGGLCCGVLGIAAYQLTAQFGTPENGVFSIGYETLQHTFAGSFVYQVLLILLVFKFVAVVINYATGGSGGLFSPTLFLGAMVGGLAGLALAALQTQFAFGGFPPAPEMIGGCVLLGMGAMFGAVIRCPMSSVLIMVEMTGNYSLILPLMAANLISWGIASKLRPISIYDSLLLQDGVNLRRLPAYRGPRDYEHLPVSAIMTHEPVALKAMDSVEESYQKVKASARLHRSFPIVDDDYAFQGSASLDELRRESAELSEKPTASLISRSVDLFIFPETSIKAAAKRMLKDDVRQLPIVTPTKPHRLLGLVTQNDIARQQNDF